VLILIFVVLFLFFVSFQVRETETALVTRFGEPVRTITEPGLKFKWPQPIEQVHKFDSRNRVYEADIGETTTKGAVPIIVKSYVVWKIARPLEFFNAVGTVIEAERRILDQLGDTQNRVVGRHFFSEFVNSDPEKIKFKEIESEMTADLAPTMLENYGVEIRTVGIKRMEINEDVTENVFERMRAERNRRTQAILTEGEAEATKIEADADTKKTELLAAAEARAKRIRGQGDAEAAKYYQMFEANPELAMFLRDLEALQKTLEKRTTVVLSADTEPFKLLRELPRLGPVRKEPESRQNTQKDKKSD
jgi:membrane protease subunit HflC